MLDLERLKRFLLPKDPEAARRAVRTIRRRVKILERYPQLGQPLEDPILGHRDWSIPFGGSGYVARYTIDGEEVVILFVRHFREQR